MKVLLIDDSSTMRAIQRSVLTQMGYTHIEEACDGRDALRVLERASPDLILVDLNMPNMDGMEFVRACRAQGLHTPLIMVMTESDRSRIVDAAKSGVSGYVVKPFTPDVLSQRIAEVLARSAGQVSAAS